MFFRVVKVFIRRVACPDYFQECAAHRFDGACTKLNFCSPLQHMLLIGNVLGIIHPRAPEISKK
jgi:hypothetical protein